MTPRLRRSLGLRAPQTKLELRRLRASSRLWRLRLMAFEEACERAERWLREQRAPVVTGALWLRLDTDHFAPLLGQRADNRLVTVSQTIPSRLPYRYSLAGDP